LVGGGLVLVVAWLASTITGAVLASEIPNPRALGMDFAFTAAFIAITRSLWRGRTSLLPWFASVVAVTGILATGAIDATWALIAGGVIGAATAAIQPAAKA
ncbi:MAG: AzlC family protein, partial [Pseudomonadota bacterium]